MSLGSGARRHGTARNIGRKYGQCVLLADTGEVVPRDLRSKEHLLNVFQFALAVEIGDV